MLRRWIVVVVQTVDVAILKHIWMKLKYRLDILRATRGALVEVG